MVPLLSPPHVIEFSAEFVLLYPPIHTARKFPAVLLDPATTAQLELLVAF